MTDYNQIYSDGFKVFKEASLGHITAKYEEISLFLKKLEQEINSYKNYQKSAIENKQADDIKSSIYLIDFQKRIYMLIDEINSHIHKEYASNQPVLNLEKNYTDYLNQFEIIVEVEQEQDRFKITGNESFKFKFLKPLKSFLFYASTLPQRFANFYYRLRKIEIKPVPFWKHQIPIHQINKTFVFQPLLNSYALIEYEFYFDAIKILIDLKNQLNDAIIKPVCLQSFEINWDNYFSTLIEKVNNEINQIEKTNKTAYEDCIQKSGTIEYPSKRLARMYARVKQKSDHQLNTNSEIVQMTFDAFTKKWYVQLSLLNVIAHTSLSISKFKMQFNERINNAISDSIKQQANFVAELVSEFQAVDQQDKTTLRSFIVKGIYKINKVLAKQVEDVSNLLFAQNLLNITDKLEVDILNHLDQLPEKVIIVKAESFLTGIRASDINYFLLKESLALTNIPVFANNIIKLKQNLTAGLEKINNEANDFHQILDFCFDSALDILDHEDVNSKEENPVEILTKGLQQATEKNAGFLNLLQDFNATFNAELTKCIHEFYNNILVLQNNDSLTEINLRLAKAKMLSRTKFLKKKIREIFVNSAKSITGFFNKIYRKIILLNEFIQDKLHLKKPPEQISSQLSNFLLASHENVNKLPSVYRRLFELKPVEELNLFLYRKSELEKLNDAYNDWKNGKYAVSVVVGENGSGKTSLLNNFVKSAKLKHNLIYHTVNAIYFTENDFYTFISQLFKVEISTKINLQEHIDSLDNKKIVIIDGLEKLYLRKVNGYNCLLNLLELIVQTNNKIFWILSSNYYSWNYLNKVIDAKDYFDYRIDLEEFESDEIKNVILKRNRLSGYKLKYLPSPEDEKNRKYQILTDLEKQEFLEKKYFEQFNKFAEGNISLALSYWLNSVDQIKENTLFIKSFKAMQFSFLNTLSSEKIYTLLLIVFHGKISVEYHADIFHQPEEKSRRVLLVMSEDAILIRKDELYYINYILFRNIIELLKNKNLIH